MSLWMVLEPLMGPALKGLDVCGLSGGLVIAAIGSILAVSTIFYGALGVSTSEEIGDTTIQSIVISNAAWLFMESIIFAYLETTNSRSSASLREEITNLEKDRQILLRRVTSVRKGLSGRQNLYSQRETETSARRMEATLKDQELTIRSLDATLKDQRLATKTLEANNRDLSVDRARLRRRIEVLKTVLSTQANMHSTSTESAKINKNISQ